MRPILQLGDPVLRERCARVEDSTSGDIRELVRDFADTLAHWRNNTGYGRGIAAPQIGVLRRVIFLQLPDSEPWPLINPEIVERSAEEITVWDACLSFLRTRVAIALLKFLARTNTFHVEYAINGQNSVEMINFMLQQLGKISLVAGVHGQGLALHILITHRDDAVPLHLHKNCPAALAGGSRP